MNSLVITVVGPDRPGLVESLSRAIADQEGSWVESSLSHLAGQFAGVVRVRVPPENTQALRDSLEALNTDVLRVVVQSGAEAEGEPRKTVELDVVGSDRPGIVQAVSKALTELGVNVESLDTACEGAPWSGGDLFKAAAKIHVPDGVALGDVRIAVEAVAADMMVDIKLEEG